MRKLTSKQRTGCGPTPWASGHPASAVKTALRALARRWQALQAEIDELEVQLTPLVTAVSPRAAGPARGRGGDRQANSALWRIALVRMGCHQPTRDYVARRTAEGKTKTEIMRCLKRYIAREVFPLLVT